MILRRGLRGSLRIALLVVGACTPATETKSDAARPRLGPATSFVVLPDTQFYACAYPEIFAAQAQYVADNVAQLGLGIALHTGDIVDSNVPAQWEVAAETLHRLDGLLPYLLVPGNHDLDQARGTLLHERFGPSDLGASQAIEMGFAEAGRIDNGFAVVELRGSPWLFVGLEFAPRDSTIAWASQVLRTHAAMPAVLFTHAYLYSDGARYDRGVTPPQPYHPDQYGVTPGQGIADGEDLWQALVLPHENVRLVLSGHVIPDGVARSTATRPSGSQVHQVLANFQTCDFCPCAEVQGGGGYLRLFSLDEAQRTLRVSTYSPYLDRYLTDPENQFDLPLSP